MAALQAATHRTIAVCSRLQPALRGLRTAWAPARQPGAASAAQLQRRAAASRVVMASAETEVAGGGRSRTGMRVRWPSHLY